MIYMCVFQSHTCCLICQWLASVLRHLKADKSIFHLHIWVLWWESSKVTLSNTQLYALNVVWYLHLYAYDMKRVIILYHATNILLPCLFFLHSSLLTFIHPNQVWWSRFEYFTSGLLAVQSAVSLLALWWLWWCTTSCYKQESMLLPSTVGVFHSVKKFTIHCHPENEKKYRLREMKICKNKVSAEL